MFACQRDPSRGWSLRRILLLFVSCQDWHGRILTVIVYFYKVYFNTLAFRLNLEDSAPIFRVPVSNFLISSVFQRRLGIFPQVFFCSSGVLRRGLYVWFFWLLPRELLRFSFRWIFSEVSTLVSGLIFSSYRSSVNGLLGVFLICPFFSGGIQSFWKECFALMSSFFVSIPSALCSCSPLTKKVSTVAFILYEGIFSVAIIPRFLWGGEDKNIGNRITC